MDIKKDYKVELKKYPTNLYRDDLMKSAIMTFLNLNQRQHVTKQLANGLLNQSTNLTKKATISADKGDISKNLVCLQMKNSEKSTVFDIYEFSLRKSTKLIALADIVKQEKGQKGIDEMNKKNADIIKSEQQQNLKKGINEGPNWCTLEDSLKFENEVKTEDVMKQENTNASCKKLTVERTLKLDKASKDLQITTTMKKMGNKKTRSSSQKKSQEVMKSVVNKAILGSKRRAE